MNIKIAGTGCPKCDTVYNNTLTAIKSFPKINFEVTKVEKLKDIIKLGIMTTPTFLIDDKIISSGAILTVSQIIEFIEKHQ